MIVNAIALHDTDTPCDTCPGHDAKAVIGITFAATPASDVQPGHTVNVCAAHAGLLAAVLANALSSAASASTPAVPTPPAVVTSSAAPVNAATLYSVAGCKLLRQTPRARRFGHVATGRMFWLPRSCHEVAQGSGVRMAAARVNSVYQLRDVPGDLIIDKGLSDVVVPEVSATDDAPTLSPTDRDEADKMMTPPAPPATADSIGAAAQALRDSNPETAPPTDEELRQSPEEAARGRAAEATAREISAATAPVAVAVSERRVEFPAVCAGCGGAYQKRDAVPEATDGQPVVGWCPTCDDVVKGREETPAPPVPQAPPGAILLSDLAASARATGIVPTPAPRAPRPSRAKTSPKRQPKATDGMEDWPDVI